MTKETGTPQIRFSGYNDTWEQRKLPEFVSFFNGLTYTPDDVQETGTLVLRSSNVKNGEVVDADNVYVSDKVVTSENVQEGDIIVVIRNGSRALIGKHAQIKASMPNTVIGAFMSGIRSEHSSFINALLDTSAFENEIAKNMGATINQITGYMFSKMEFMIPSEEEQQKIGEYFSNLDNLITLHQRKYNKLVKVKKSMLEKMFPREGAKVPEIRFYGFTDDWEQRKLLDCIQKITDFRGRTPKKLGMDWSEEGYLALSALNVKDGYIDFNQDVHYGNQELYDKWMTGNELHKGQVLFTTEAPMGNVAQVPDNRRYILSQRTIAFEVKNKLITENFLATVLRTPTVFADLTALSSGGTAKGVSQKSLASVEIRLPKNLNEQEKIANTFYNLDHLITLHQRKLEKLKNLKKACLKKMFI